MQNWIIFFVLIAVSIFLMIYVYKKDRVEKEPIGFLLKLTGVGVLFGLIWLGIVMLVLGVCTSISGEPVFANYAQYSFYNLFVSFLLQGLILSAFKFLPLWYMIRRSSHFNCTFDALVYSVFYSLGFGISRFIFSLIVMDKSLNIILLLPLEFFTAIIFGIFYSRAHKKLKDYRKKRAMRGLFDKAIPGESVVITVQGFLIAAFLEGFVVYEDMNGFIGLIITMLITALLTYLSYLYVEKYSEEDRYE